MYDGTFVSWLAIDKAKKFSLVKADEILQWLKEKALNLLLDNCLENYGG